MIRLRKILKKLDVDTNDDVIAELDRLEKFFKQSIILDNLFDDEHQRVYEYLTENGENILDYSWGEIIDLIIDEKINER